MVMYEGRIVKEIDSGSLSEDAIVRAALGEAEGLGAAA